MRLIDADALETRLANLYGMWILWSSWKRVRVTIEDMPTVDPVKHGHWIFYKDMGNKYIRCSNCGAESGYDDEINWLWGDYCKYCGAKMDEEVTTE